MEALSAWRTDALAAERVFALASPVNQAFTGPLPRFKRLVESPAFACLIDNRGYVIGRATSDGQVAAVLVSLVDRQDQLRLFRFYLTRIDESGPPRWATEAVLEVGADAPDPAGKL